MLERRGEAELVEHRRAQPRNRLAHHRLHMIGDTDDRRRAAVARGFCIAALASRMVTASTLMAFRYCPNSSCSARARLRRSSSWMRTFSRETPVGVERRGELALGLAASRELGAHLGHATPGEERAIAERDEHQHAGQLVDLVGARSWQRHRKEELRPGPARR